MPQIGRPGLVGRFMVRLHLAVWLGTVSIPAWAQPSPFGPPIATWAPNGTVNALALDGDTLYVGGSFDHVGPATGGFAAVNALNDTQITTGAKLQPWVVSVLSDGAGGWYVVESQSVTFVLPVFRLHHVLASGVLDPAWTVVTLDGAVYGMVLEGGKLFVAGAFRNVSGVLRVGLAALDPGTGLLLFWNAGLNDYVLSITNAPGRIYVAGTFRNLGSTVRNGFAVIDATTAAAMPPTLPSIGTQSFVGAMATAGNRLYLYGACQNGQIATCAYDLDLIPDPAWTFPNVQQPLAATTGALFAVEPGISTAEGRIRKLDPATGVDLAWTTPRFSGGVIWSLKPSGSRLYIGGEFEIVNGQARRRIAALDATSGALQSWAPRVSAQVRALDAQGNDVAFGGLFNSVGGIAKQNLVALDLRTGRPAVPDLPNADLRVRAMLLVGNVLVVGGDRLMVGTTPGPSVVAFTVGTGTPFPWSLDTNGSVETLAVDSRRLYIGGNFSTAGSVPRLNFAAVDLLTGTLTPWNPSPDQPLTTLATLGGAVYATGSFRTVPGYGRNGVVAWDAATGNVLPFDPASNAGFLGAPAAFYRDRVLMAGSPFTVGPPPLDAFRWVDRISGGATSPRSTAAMSVAATAQAGSTIYAVGVTPTGGAVVLMDVPSGAVDVWNAGTSAPILRIAASVDYVAFSGQFTSFPGLPVSGLTVYRAPRAAVPRRLTSGVRSSTVTLGWEAGGAPATASFIVEVGTSTGATDVGSFLVGSVTRVSGQLPAGAYFTRVRGVGAGGNGPSSSEVIVTVPATATAPNAPGALTSAVSGRIVSLLWSAASGNASTYVIDVGTASGLADLGSYPTATLDTSFITPAPAGTYFVRVRAANAFGSGPPTNEVAVVVP